MRDRLISQLNDALRCADSKTVEKVLFAPVQIKDDSELVYHKHSVLKNSKLLMTNLCVLGIVIDGVPIAGVYDDAGELVGFK